MTTSMIKPIGYLFLKWRSVVALLGGILMAMVVLLFATLGQSPAQAASPPPPHHIAAGYNHSLAIDTQTGHVYSWGANFYGQLGVNSNNDHHTPVLVHGPNNQGYLSNVTYVDAGEHHSLALKEDGTVYAWGGNGHGQLGDDTTKGRLYPVQVHGGQQGLDPSGNNVLHDIVAVAAGYEHSLALASDGTVYAWGENFLGQLGVNSYNDQHTPVQVHGPDNVGYLGDGTEGPSKTAPIVDVSAYTHSLALASDGHVYAWGDGYEGQLGVNSNNHHHTPVQVHGLNNQGYLGNIVDVAAGTHHSLAVGGDGHVYSWGDNLYGQLGVGTFGEPDKDHDNRYYPVQVSSPAGFVAVDGGRWHSAAVQTPGVLWAWGDNAWGQLGRPQGYVPVPTPAYVGPFISVATGDIHTLAARSNGTVWAWGDNAHGKLGDGTTTSRDTPVQVGGLVGGPPQEDTIKPYVKQVVPADAASGVPRGSKLIASFSEKMDAATINQQTFTLMKEGTTTPLAAKVSYNLATNKATLNPNKPLSKGQSYTATVSTEAKDLAGNQLDQDHASSDDQPMEWTFTVKN